jgi:hypothetical protein
MSVQVHKRALSSSKVSRIIRNGGVASPLPSQNNVAERRARWERKQSEKNKI